MTTRTFHRTALLLLVLGACSRGEPAPTAPSPTAPEMSSPAPTGMPKIEASDVDELVGRVRTVLPAGHYTYMKLDADGTERWVVVLGTPTLTLDDYVDVDVYGFRQDFPSRRLDRNFDELFFGRIRSAT